MKRTLLTGATALALALPLALASASPAAAAKPASPGDGGACAKAGLDTLRSLDALQAAARGEVDYDAFDSDAGAEPGPIRTDLPEGSFLSLGAVVKLHTQSPDLFAWCD